MGKPTKTYDRLLGRNVLHEHDLSHLSGSITAADTTIADAGGYYTGTTVEAALQEIGAGTTLDGRYLQIANDLSDLNNVATARTNLGLVAGGAGDIWVEKAGDSMTGALSIALATASSNALTLKSSDDDKTNNLLQLLDSTNAAQVTIKADGATVFNEQGNGTADFRIEGQGNTHTFFVDVDQRRIGINTSSPSTTVDIRGGLLVNDDALDADCRFEGETDPNLFYIDAGNNKVGVGTSTLTGKLHVSTGGINNIGLLVKGVASQNSSLQEWQDSSGNVLAGIAANGALRLPIETVTASSDTLDNSNFTVICDTSSNAITINLPTVFGAPGRIYNIKCDDPANDVTVDPLSTQTIDGNTTLTISFPDSVMIQAASDEWKII